MAEWAQAAFDQNHEHRGDQDLLSWLIAHRQFQVDELSEIYNWPIGYGENPQAVIHHWIGESAKNVLANQIALHSMLIGGKT